MSETATARYGVTSMVTPLSRVLMRVPGDALLTADPETWHYAEPLDPHRLQAQYEAFTDLVKSGGADVEWIPDTDDGLADSVFTFDPSFMISSGAILMRPGKRLREPEVALHRAAYERLGVPIVGAIEVPGIAEGGDCLWVNDSTLAVGRGYRTNQSGIDQLRAICEPYGIEVKAFDLPVWGGDAACMHLLSLVSPLDRDLALVYARLLPVALYELLLDRGYRLIEAPDEEFLASSGLNLNVLATAPRRCIALDRFPETARLMREAGCELSLFEGDALCIPCEGGPTCLTRPLLRQ